ncbi:hypothetical protein MNBD_GAMMA24-2082 [hydrothermal vent metagenome]|uniref:Uncharacterized protein n=1 Tax=hydrothermal vent metagenome TaxID=652676 RepID=A0A3B1C3U0_9ZZZZ
MNIVILSLHEYCYIVFGNMADYYRKICLEIELEAGEKNIYGGDEFE